MKTIEPPGWAPPSGYANGVLAEGRVLAVAGQVGWNPSTCRFDAVDFVGQVRQALENVVAVVRAAGGEPRHVVRLTWFVLDRGEYEAARSEIGRVYRAVFERHFPAMSLIIVAGLLEPGARVEIEATAVLPAAG